MGGVPGARPASPGARRLAGAVLAALAVLALAGCRADVVVEVDAGAGGAGHVRAVLTLDEEAAAQVPDLARQLRVEDLEAAGWEVDGPDPVPGGGLTLRASKPFSSTAGADRALDELTGPDGPFGSLRLTRGQGLLRARTTLEGTVDLSAGLGAFGDDTLRERLGNDTLGLDPAELEHELGRPLAEVLVVELAARLPGSAESNAPSRREGALVWPVPLGTVVQVEASSEAWEVARTAFGALAAASALALVAVLVRRVRRR